VDSVLWNVDYIESVYLWQGFPQTPNTLADVAIDKRFFYAQEAKMTIRELAEAAGCNEKTVRRITTEIFPNKIVNGKVTRFTWSEAHTVMDKLPKKNIVQNVGQMSEVALTNVRGNKNDHIDAFAKIAEAMSAIATVVKSIGDRVNVIEQKIEDRQSLLPAPGIDTKNHITKITREYAVRKNIKFPDAYGKLYREFGYRTHTNPCMAAKNRGMTIIEYIESEGQLEILLAVAIEVLN